MAVFSFQKTLEHFDFKFLPSLDAKVIRELPTGRYLEHGGKCPVAGSTGLGQNPSGGRVGVKACEQGR
jgi:hypothetical protein